MKISLDKKIAMSLLAVSGGILVYWLIRGLILLYGWLKGLGEYNAGWWISLGQFLYRNLSIVIVIYVIICLQVAGLMEFKFRRNFLKAFLLSLVLTPPGMLLLWGRKQDSDNSKRE